MTARRHRLGVLALVLLAAGACKDESVADPTLPALVAASDVADTNVGLVSGAREVVPVEADDPSKGAAEPLVVVVEYSDFQCPHCGRFAASLDELVAAYPDDVRIVFKQFPLPMHPDAEIGARAALAARAQGKFWAMHDRLFAERTKMSRDDVVAHAKSLGLDLPAFETALDDGSTGARVAADKRAGAVIGVRGTPSFFVNGLPFSGALPPDELNRVIEEERALGRRLIDAGSPRAHIPGIIMRAAGKAAASP